jgi:DHA1 family multidrug resistance protein-like MFS transporter
MIGNHVRLQFSEAWQRTLYITFIAQILTAIGFSSIFPFLPLYVESLGSSSHLSIEFLAGLVFSAQAFCMMLASPIWGAIADRYGRKLMVQRACFGGVVIVFLMAFVRSAEQLVILRAIQGLITGSVAASSALIAAEAPRARTGYALGLLQTGLGVGIALGPLIGGAVADAFGYSAAFYITAALLLVSGVLVLFGVEETYVPSSTPTFDVRGFFTDWRHIFASPGVTATYSLDTLTQLARAMIVPILPIFIQSFMTDISSVNTITGIVFGVYSATMTISAIYFGKLGDRIGHRIILIVSIISLTFFYLPQAFVTEAWQILALQAMAGVAMGGILPSIGALLAKLTVQGEEGAVYGLSNSLRAGARSVAPLLGAGIATWLNNQATFVFAAGVYLLAGVLASIKLSHATNNTSLPIK